MDGCFLCVEPAPRRYSRLTQWFHAPIFVLSKQEWQRHVDHSSGKSYFYNLETHKSTWTDPRGADHVKESAGKAGEAAGEAAGGGGGGDDEAKKALADDADDDKTKAAEEDEKHHI